MIGVRNKVLSGGFHGEWTVLWEKEPRESMLWDFREVLVYVIFN